MVIYSLGWPMLSKLEVLLLANAGTDVTMLIIVIIVVLMLLNDHDESH